MFLFLLLTQSNALWGGRMVIALLSFPYIIVKAKNIVKGLLYLCPQILFMAGKYIKIVTFLALIIIVVIQGVWLANTYRLVESRLSSASARLFPRAVVDEAWERLNSLAGETGEREPLGTSMNYKDMDGLLGLFDHMAIYLNEYNDSVYQSEISLPLLDSIFTTSLSKEGFHAKLVCEVVDSLGMPIRSEASDLSSYGSRMIKTPAVPLNTEHTEAVRAVIVNPYWVIIRQMGALLIATAVLILFVAGCVIYQVRIIIRQDKIAHLRQDFTYAMIHDMKTPISTISMAGHALESGMLDHNPELRKQYFSVLNEESARLLGLSEKILTIAKLEQSHLRLNREAVDLNAMFEELIHKYEVKAEKKVTFERTCAITSTLMADGAYLREAISNLIDNSLKYSDDPVTIRLSAEERENNIQIKVWDNGWGIPLRQRKRIFEKFQRGGLEYRKDKSVSGFGLGLNYVYRVIMAMNGSVAVNSIEGEYSEFVLTLPIQKEVV